MGNRRTSWYPPPAATASALANEAAARGLRPPLQLTDDSRGWLLVPGDPDSLYANEFGELVWGRPLSQSTVQLIRKCWPEEGMTLAADIAATADLILGVRLPDAHHRTPK